MVLLEETSLADVLVKVAMFIVVQALVYLILSNSSNIFSKNKINRSFSFKPARSVSIRRMLAAVSDMPAGGELSPASSVRGGSRTSPNSQDSDPIFDDCKSSF